MSDAILGRKIGMTQIFAEDGRCIPVTILKAGPCVVVREKTPDKDGYSAVQLGFESLPKKKVTKPKEGYFKKNKVDPVRVLREITPDSADKYKPGSKVTAEQVFSPGDCVSIIGTSKGKGFAGVMKRWNFHGGPAGHGSHFHRTPGSIGAGSWPSRTFKGKKLPGQMGNKRVTIPNLQVVDVPKGKDLILVRGPVPGSKGSLVLINKIS